ncbi:hypothetical protein HN51_060441 [Arachis hypogaea]|uniref:Exostosin GT47 domain-containing protein n=1 Tax=Arachis hypogaea TaxID=3818 RepID=A0A444X9T5_ARAHY|nr:probable arabinosyltransferase ARAD1 [Arachis ipaensis]XP_025685702.1 probable arabinosyltransferase ARAD1 [Arachis hypogaea]RYQ86434.1 hypothetical protein Ahy_B10g106104 [Arachis hypogaea]
MIEKNVSSIKVIVSRKSLLLLFTMTSTLFLMSWFFVLHSTSQPQSIDNKLIPNSRRFSNNNNDYATWTPEKYVEPSVGNRAILVNSKDASSSSQDSYDEGKCNKNNEEVVIKIFMYDLPSKFHFGLLDWKEKNSVWPDIRGAIPGYPGGLNLQHSIEFWLTLDLLASEIPNAPKASAAVRVHNSSEADIIFVPFFSSLSYNRYSKTNQHGQKSRNKVLQEELVEYLAGQELWKRSGGKDHLILAHHPNSMLDARVKLWPATFILSDFGRYPPNIANVEKDVIAPYKHVINSYVNDTSTFDTRPTLLYFQGAIYRKDGGVARQELFYLLKDEKDVHFSFGSVQKDGIQKATQGMRSSKFCLNIAGDTPSSNRLFDAIASHCVPVIISDAIELPYEDVLDYSEFCLFVPTRDAIQGNYLINLIRNVTKDEWTRMWNRLKEVEPFFEFQFPSKEGDAVQMIWQAVARRVPAVRLKMNKSKRFSRCPSTTTSDVVEKSIHVPSNFW